MAITFTICPANGPPEWIGTALPENAGYEAVRSVVEGRLGGPMAHLRCGEGTRQLSVLVNEAAELAGEPLNIMATAILRAYLGGRAAPGSRTCPTKIHGVAIIPDHALMF